jgi:transposase
MRVPVSADCDTPLARWRPRRTLRREIVHRPSPQAGFQLLPRRWVGDRTVGGRARSRRLSQDYESLPATSEVRIDVAMIRLMLRRLEQD